MLLTSGQVSVALSSFVVFMFTSALFLSGYVLQQQTVRDLRAAIQPKPTPEAARLYLPSQFAVQLTPSPKASADQYLEEINGNTQVTKERRDVVGMERSSDEIFMDAPRPIQAAVLDDMGDGQRPEKSRSPVQDDSQRMDMEDDQKPMAMMEEQPLSRPGMPEEASSVSSAEDQPKKEKTLSRAERRKKIKEEIMAAGDGEGFKGYKRRQY